MSVKAGLLGLIGGIVLYGFAAWLWWSAQFVSPLLAGVMLWVGLVGLAFAFAAPAYHWFGLPAYRLYRRRTA